MDQVKIENRYVEAVISTQAAEVISFKRKDNGIEAIWCRDPKYWRNCNPILFPYTGRLIDGSYDYMGKEYKLGQHGFARDAVFKIEKAEADSAVLSLTYDEETMKVYPFRFKLVVTYRLRRHKLHLSYHIYNLENNVNMPFDIGFHPAFNCPLTPDGHYEDYRIEFEMTEKLYGERHDDLIIPDGSQFSLSKYLQKGSFFYNNDQIMSNWVQMTDGRHTIRVSKEGFETIGFWRPSTDAPLICIEPWHPKNNLDKTNFFREDTLVNVLEPHDDFECHYYIELVR